MAMLGFPAIILKSDWAHCFLWSPGFQLPPFANLSSAGVGTSQRVNLHLRARALPCAKHRVA